MVKVPRLLAVMALLAACGGGGDDDDSPGAPDARPATADASVGPAGDVQVTHNGAVVASGDSFAFGDILAGSVGARYAFTIENVGDGDLAVTSIAIAGADAASFDVGDGDAAVLAPGASRAFTVAFTPATTGAKAASLAIASDDPDEPSYDIALAGTGVAPEDLAEDTDGDWDGTDFTAYNTVESRIVVRVGDIDNLGFGWPVGFNPFSGQSTPSHGYPWTPGAGDPPGTDRIMVVSSYAGSPPAGADGYTSSTSRPDNLPQAITLTYDLMGSVPTSAVLQLFVDDFQAPVWAASYQVTLDGTRATFLEDVLNSLVQTGPIGKLITVPVPPELVDLLADGELAILIDDPVTGAGDGFAVDFVKLFIDVYGFKNTGTLTGTVTETGTGTPVADAAVSASGFVTTTTDAAGVYTLTGVPAGFVYLQVGKPGFQPHEQLVDLQTDQTRTINVTLAPE